MTYTVRTPEGDHTVHDVSIVQAWIRQGRISGEDPVFFPGFDRWVQAADVEHFAALAKVRAEVSTPWGAWLWSLKRHPTRGGLFGWLLIGVTIPIALVAIFAGVGLFPGGRYPVVVLAIPGLLLVGVFLAGATSLSFWLTRKAGPVSSFVVPCRRCLHLARIRGAAGHEGNRCEQCGEALW
jgi:hypothetical protein